MADARKIEKFNEEEKVLDVAFSDGDFAPLRKIYGKILGVKKSSAYVYQRRSLIKYDLADRRVIWSSRLRETRAIDSHTKLWRLGGRIIRAGCDGACIGQESLFIWTRRRMWILSLSDGKVIRTERISGNKRPLAATWEQHRGQDSFVFGEYYSNPNKAPVNLFRYSIRGIEQIYQFSGGEINHIHTVFCHKPGTYVVLVGDFEKSPAIWIVKNGFGKILAGGEQIYRACCGFINHGALFYSTDTSTADNQFRKINLATGVEETICDLPAPSIYFSAFADGMLFSTNLEPVLDSKNHFFRKWLTKKLPAYIRTEQAGIYRASESDCDLLMSFEPTTLPYRLFQYPTFRPSASDEWVAFYCQSIRNLDGYSLYAPSSYFI